MVRALGHRRAGIGSRLWVGARVLARARVSARLSLSLYVSALKGPCLGVPHEHVLARDAHVGELDKTIIDPMPALRDPPSAAHVRKASQTCLCVSTAACHSVCLCVCVWWCMDSAKFAQG
jgi:hypothetical protein